MFRSTTSQTRDRGYCDYDHLIMFAITYDDIIRLDLECHHHWLPDLRSFKLVIVFMAILAPKSPYHDINGIIS